MRRHQPDLIQYSMCVKKLFSSKLNCFYSFRRTKCKKTKIYNFFILCVQDYYREYYISHRMCIVDQIKKKLIHAYDKTGFILMFSTK